MKKLSSLRLVVLSATFSALSASQLFAAENFPNISGQVLYQVQADRITSSQRSGVAPNNAFVYIEPRVNLNFNKNWAIATQWRLQPNNIYTTRDSVNSERYRTFLQQGRGLKLGDEGLLVEELKLDFKNDDAKFSIGKFDPGFGMANDKTKRIGIFTPQFAEDYNLREKMGGSITAFLENSQINFSTFFNDTTGLSRSAIDDRGRASRNDNLAGNTGTLSSYLVSFKGDNLMGQKEWSYNLAYRSLGVDNGNGARREFGYLLSSQYRHELGLDTNLVPFIEITKINNFTGEQDRNALYTTLALSLEYRNWNVGVSSLNRDIKQPQRSSNISDRQLQVFAGYKFNKNFAVNFTRSELKENGYRAAIFGLSLDYIHKF